MSTNTSPRAGRLGLLFSFGRVFLGQAPRWYKWTVVGFLLANVVLARAAGPFATGWAVVGEFIFTLAMALKCHPLPAGGLLALEAVLLGLTDPAAVYAETTHNLPVLLLLLFMVAGIYFMQDVLRFGFSLLFARVRSRLVLSLFFCFFGALLSAFLDALTVVAVMIAVARGFYEVYHGYLSEQGERRGQGLAPVSSEADDAADLARFRAALRGLLMHGAVGTALGGAATLVGEPQNLLVAKEAGWNFGQFFLAMAPVTVPVFAAGLATCVVTERFRLFGFGVPIPETARRALLARSQREAGSAAPGASARLWVQGLVAVVLVAALALHMAEVGLIGLMVIVLLTAFTGVIEEERIGYAFHEALPFAALLVVFFAVVAVIHDQGLFTPVAERLFAFTGKGRLAAFYLASGLLSAISDNVFVATVYMAELKKALAAGVVSRPEFALLAVAVNTGTNIPSIATPNGQAAFLFLLTSTAAQSLRLSYGRMLVLALPYTAVLTVVGLAAVRFLL